MNRGNGIRTIALAIVVGCSSWQMGHSATINLSTPVSNSVGTITGIYWTGNSVTPASPNDTTPDSSGNGYTGLLQLYTGTSIGLTTGVNRAGTSGYSNGIRLATSGTTASDGNPNIVVNLPTPNSLEMVATDFTGGAWLNFNSILSGAQTVTVMNRGYWNSATVGSWGLDLVKDASGDWQMVFQVSNGVTSENQYIAMPSIAVGEWHHFGFSYDYVAAGKDVVTFSMDGISLGTGEFSNDIASGTTTSHRRFNVGERGTSTYNSVFDGTVDDVFVTTGLYDFGAIPEPGTAALLFLSAGVLLMGRRRRVAFPLA